MLTEWAARATIVEPNPTHADLAEKNARSNGVEARVEVVRAAAADAPALESDLVIANPPYFSEEEGDISPATAKASSRALLLAPLVSFALAARRIARRFVVAFPSARFSHLLDALAAARFVPKRARFVHPRVGREAQVVFVEAKIARPGGLVVEAPLVVRGEGEAYTREVDDTLRGRWPSP